MRSTGYAQSLAFPKGCGLYKTQCRGACKATVLGGGGKIQDGVLIGEDRYCFKYDG